MRMSVDLTGDIGQQTLLIITSQESPVTSPEDNPAFSESLNKEKTLVEILLRKYGFGQWKAPLEV